MKKPQTRVICDPPRFLPGIHNGFSWMILARFFVNGWELVNRQLWMHNEPSVELYADLSRCGQDLDSILTNTRP